LEKTDLLAEDLGKTPGGEGLYQRLLGAAWHDLAEPVRRSHADSSEVRCTGEFRIRHGAHPGARLIAQIARLPRESGCAAARLRIVPTEGGERWERFFDGRAFTSRQRAEGGLLVERVGAAEYRFRLAAEDGALIYRAAGVALRIGPLRLFLPSFVTPRAAGKEESREGRAHIFVEVSLPLIGRLIEYEGFLEREGPSG
jgi:hypothetical protein